MSATKEGDVNAASRKTLGLGGVAAVALLVSSFGAARAEPVDLGAAGPDNFAVLGIGARTISVNNPSDVVGNVGVAQAGGALHLSSTTIFGTAFLHTGAGFQQSNSTVTGGVVQNAATDVFLGQAVTDALNASTIARGLAATNPTTTVNLNGGTMTLAGVAGRNVVNLTGLTLNGGADLILSGPAGSSWVVNDTGGFNLTGGSTITLMGGLTPTDILFNLTGTGNAQFSGGGGGAAALDGVLLAPDRDVNLAPGIVTGEVIAGGDITIVSGGRVVTPTPAPEPSSIALCAAGLGALGGYRLVRRRRRPAPGPQGA
jgi:hypothetical protein